MKNLKRFGSLFLSLMLTLALAVPAFAAVEDTGYSDVDADAWYAEAVIYCRAHGLMDGVGGGRFDPDGTLTRAQLATVLYRMEGEPSVAGEDSFTDTDSGAWYSNAVLWASQQKLMEGYGNDRFGTNDPVTRQDMTAVLFTAMRIAPRPTMKAVTRMNPPSRTTPPPPWTGAPPTILCAPPLRACLPPAPMPPAPRLPTP